MGGPALSSGATAISPLIVRARLFDPNASSLLSGDTALRPRIFPWMMVSIEGASLTSSAGLAPDAC